MATVEREGKGARDYHTGDVVLTMTSDEAITLRAILDRVAGNRRESLRLHSNKIAVALREAGVAELHQPYGHFIVGDHITALKVPAWLRRALYK